MPRPPILPVPDREQIFASGVDWEAWLANPDEPEQADRLRAVYDELTLDDELTRPLRGLSRPVRVIAIAETWCGDVIRHTPLLIRLVEETGGRAEIRFVSREQHPDFFVRFLTNGGEAIPKFVFCNESFTEVGNWGPMSSTPRMWIAQGKACDDVAGARRRVSQFYDEDQRRESTRELVALFQVAAFPGF